jgi:three-Cys-motif partner protein
MSESRIWKPHSRIKLRFYKHYVQICASHHIKDNYERFTLVDLFCGEPRIQFEGNNYIDGSPLIALKKKVKCVFNDISETVVENVKNLNNKYPQQIIEVFNSDANENIEAILEKVPSYFHSLFYLDPDNVSQISFETMKLILDFLVMIIGRKLIKKVKLPMNGGKIYL